MRLYDLLLWKWGWKRNRSHRYGVNKRRPRNGHKYTKDQVCLSKTIEVICIKQHLINIWSSIHEKVKQHWGWVEKSVACKKACISRDPQDIYKKHFDDLLIFFRLLFQKMSFQNPRFKNFFLETITDWLWQLQHHIGEKAFLLSSATYFLLCFVFVQAFFISNPFFDSFSIVTYCSKALSH